MVSVPMPNEIREAWIGLAPATPSRALKAALNGIDAPATVASAIQKRLFTGFCSVDV
jgi:hypothetical protein